MDRLLLVLRVRSYAPSPLRKHIVRIEQPSHFLLKDSQPLGVLVDLCKFVKTRPRLKAFDVVYVGMKVVSTQRRQHRRKQVRSFTLTGPSPRHSLFGTFTFGGKIASLGRKQIDRSAICQPSS